MYTLVLNGSPRPGGDTDALCEAFARSVRGRAETVRAYGADVSPCLDCRACRRTPGCRVHDGMDEIYPKLKACDGLILASPVYFGTISTQMKQFMDRNLDQCDTCLFTAAHLLICNRADTGCYAKCRAGWPFFFHQTIRDPCSSYIQSLLS